MNVNCIGMELCERVLAKKKANLARLFKIYRFWGGFTFVKSPFFIFTRLENILSPNNFFFRNY